MAPIVASTEISRRPEEVFAYVTDLTHLPEWQESVVSVKTSDIAPAGGGSRVVVTRRVGPREMEMTAEISVDPPTSWSVRGVDVPFEETSRADRAARRRSAFASDDPAGLRGSRPGQVCWFRSL